MSLETGDFREGNADFGPGGTAGLVVANRLSESGNFRVLVLEAGPEPTVVSAYKPLGGNQLLSGRTQQ